MGYKVRKMGELRQAGYRFYLNLVGYKENNIFKFFNIVKITFYLNLVGYKGRLYYRARRKDSVLSELSGI